MSESPLQRGRPGTADALLDAVDALLAERGWAACSLQAVARRAGLTTGAIYSTFGSRGALLTASVVRRSGDHARLTGRTLKVAVTRYAASYWAVFQEAEGVNLVLAQLELLRMAATDPSIAEALQDQYALMLGDLASDLEARGARSPREMAVRLSAVLQGMTLQEVGFGAGLTEKAFVEAALNAVR